MCTIYLQICIHYIKKYWFKYTFIYMASYMFGIWADDIEFISKSWRLQILYTWMEGEGIWKCFHSAREHVKTIIITLSAPNIYIRKVIFFILYIFLRHCISCVCALCAFIGYVIAWVIIIIMCAMCCSICICLCVGKMSDTYTRAYPSRFAFIYARAIHNARV